MNHFERALGIIAILGMTSLVTANAQIAPDLPDPTTLPCDLALGPSCEAENTPQVLSAYCSREALSYVGAYCLDRVEYNTMPERVTPNEDGTIEFDAAGMYRVVAGCWCARATAFATMLLDEERIYERRLVGDEIGRSIEINRIITVDAGSQLEVHFRSGLYESSYHVAHAGPARSGLQLEYLGPAPEPES